MDTGGLCAHMIFALRPVDKHFQPIKAHLHIAVRGLCLLLSVNAYIDFIQALFGQGNRVAIAEDSIGALTILALFINSIWQYLQID